MSRPSIVQRALGSTLSPFGSIYGAATAMRMRKPPIATAPVPVICVGNLTAGGAGKTPIALAIEKLLKAHDRRVVFLSRGHGGHEKGPVLVDHQAHTAADIGDEPLLLAASAPTIVARKRVDALSLIASLEEKPDVVIMDDGLQSPGLAKTIAIAVVDSDVGVGNGRCVPAGPLRAPVSDQMETIDCIVSYGAINGDGSKVGNDDTPAFYARPTTKLLKFDGQDGDARTFHAFCGIGRPDKFFDQLSRDGYRVAKKTAFPDHHRFSPNDLKKLEASAEKDGLALITTAKDAVRLGGMPLPTGFREKLYTLELEAEFERPQAVTRFILDRIVTNEALKRDRVR